MADAPALTPVNDPASTAQKPGWQSSEFYLSLAAMLVGFVMSAGLFPDGSPVLKALGLAASLLGALGYTVQRGLLKANGNKTAALVAAAAAAPSAPANPPQA